MMLVLDPSSEVPPYEQLRLQFAHQISSGRLPEGERLPTVRSLAAELGIAPNTVARCYRELERDGLIETRGRNGSVVGPRHLGPYDQARTAAEFYAATTRRLGLAPQEAVALVQAALGEQATDPV